MSSVEKSENGKFEILQAPEIIDVEAAKPQKDDTALNSYDSLTRDVRIDPGKSLCLAYFYWWAVGGSNWEPAD